MIFRQDCRVYRPDRRLILPERRHLIGSAKAGVMSAARRRVTTAVLLDDFSGYEQTSAGDPWTGFNLTLGSATNYILVMVSWEQGIAIAGVTVGGVSLNAGAIAGPVDATQTRTALFYLDDSGSFPTLDGDRSVIVDPDGTAFSGYAGAWALSGAASGAPNRTDTDATTGSASTSLADVPAGAFVAGGCNTNNVTISVSGEDVEDALYNNTADGGQSGGFVHNLTETLETVQHDWTGASRIAALMAEILAS